MIRAVTSTLLVNAHLANGSLTTDERPIIKWIKTFDILSFGARGSQFLGEYGGTFNLLETYGCNCHAVISGKTGSGRPVDELDKESVSKIDTSTLCSTVYKTQPNRRANSISRVQSVYAGILTMAAHSIRNMHLTLSILTSPHTRE